MMTATDRKTIRQWRDAAFLTQQELGDKVGVSNITISNWEQGSKQPMAKNMRALAAALGITPDQIILVHKAEEDNS